MKNYYKLTDLINLSVKVSNLTKRLIDDFNNIEFALMINIKN